jgi:hypothetical protein
MYFVSHKTRYIEEKIYKLDVSLDPVVTNRNVTVFKPSYIPVMFSRYIYMIMGHSGSIYSIENFMKYKVSDTFNLKSEEEQKCVFQNITTDKMIMIELSYRIINKLKIWNIFSKHKSHIDEEPIKNQYLNLKYQAGRCVYYSKDIFDQRIYDIINNDVFFKQ